MSNKRNLWPFGIVLGVALCVAGNAAFVVYHWNGETSSGHCG